MALVLLVRHGQNDWVKKNRLAGWTPGIHLNDQGRQEVEALSGRLSHLPIAAIYSSPLDRCLETAQIIAARQDLPVTELENVGEVRYGRWEGKKVKKLAKKRRKWHAVQHYPSRFRFPGGESFTEIQARATSALEELAIRHEKDMIIVVSHGDVIKLLLAHYMGMHMDLFQRIVISTASVSVLALTKEGLVRVLRVNDNGPIQAPKHKEDEQEKSGEHAQSPDGKNVTEDTTQKEELK